jgi:hypothetical protein
MACVLRPWNAAVTEISSKPTHRFSVNERVVWQWRECAPGNLDFPKSHPLNPFKSMARGTISSNQISLRALLFSLSRLIRVGWINKTTGLRVCDFSYTLKTAGGRTGPAEIVSGTRRKCCTFASLHWYYRRPGCGIGDSNDSRGLGRMPRV